MAPVRVWRVVVVLVFVVSSVVPAVFVVADSGFSDIHEAGSHQRGVERLEGLGVLEDTECEPGRFCPGDVLERWVMAVWLVRVLDGVDPVLSGPTRFVDVDPDQWWAPFVERLAVLGVTVGCARNPARYCPSAPVTRGQMASLLVRALELAPAGSAGFVDIGGNTHAGNIDAFAAAGITIGCAVNPARYCPSASVTRGQMATFLTRAIDYFPERTAVGEGETPVLSVGLSSPSSAIVMGSFEVDITFSWPVTGFVEGDIGVSNGRVTGFSGSGSSYTAAPTADGTVVVWVPASVVYDDGNNTNHADTLSRTYTADPSQTDPLPVEVSSPSSAIVMGSFEVDITFSRPVTGFVEGDIGVSNGRVTGFSGSGSSYTATIAPTADGTVVVWVPAGVASDQAGDPNQASDALSRTYVSDPGQTDPLSVEVGSLTEQVVTGSFEVGITFSRSVTGFRRRDIQVTNGTASGLVGSGSGYRVMVTPRAQGAVVVQVPGGVAHDDAGDPNQASEWLVRTFVSDTSWGGKGFNTWDRAEVVQVYEDEFERQEPEPRFTGDVDSCDAGSTSQAYRDSVVQRVNWYRMMAGLDTVTERASYTATVQEAALMMAAADRLSHNPSGDWPCYTVNGATGAGASNIGRHNTGVEAIDSYMGDGGGNNREVGHRRWILYPQLRKIGIGNVPHVPFGQTGANALYVIDDNVWGPRPDVREQRGLVAWPPPGYVPAETVWGRWSFSLPDADFSTATVTVTDQYGSVPLNVIARTGSGAPEETIVWSMYREVDSSPFSEPPDGDHCFTVTVSNVNVFQIAQSPYRYTTCVLDLGNGEEGPGSLYYQPPTWLAGGTRISYDDANSVQLIDTSGANQRVFLRVGTIIWSPNDTRIAYTSFGEIWTLDAGGHNPQFVANGYNPQWSPDGTKMAYYRSNAGVWTMNADGTNQQQLVANGGAPRWSLDGTRVAYTNNGIWSVNADGTNQRRLTTDGHNYVWSPDGTKVAYGRKIRVGARTSRPEIWIVNSDGSNPKQLARGEGLPAWSPDGTTIAYTNNGIWTTKADGTNQRQLTTGGAGPPAWSPDGTKLAYNYWGGHIRIVNADGTNQRQLSK